MIKNGLWPPVSIVEIGSHMSITCRLGCHGVPHREILEHCPHIYEDDSHTPLNSQLVAGYDDNDHDHDHRQRN